MPISDPPPGMMKSNPDAGTMSLSGTMNKAISAGKALEVEAEVAAERYTYSIANTGDCLLYTSPSPRDGLLSRMPSSA